VLKNLSIGVFDSGVGGLSVLKHIHERLPNADLLYIADHAYAPYGKRPAAEIRQRCFSIVDYLLGKNVDAIVVACNTATAAAIEELRQHTAIPIIGMEPGVKPAIEQTRSDVIAILATDNTLASKKFEQLSARFAAEKTVLVQACTDLVSMIEQGDPDALNIRQRLLEIMPTLVEKNVDTVVLGCSHYPLILDQIRATAPTLNIIDTGAAVAKETERRLKNAGHTWSTANVGQITLCTTGNAEARIPIMQKFFPHAHTHLGLNLTENIETSLEKSTTSI